MTAAPRATVSPDILAPADPPPPKPNRVGSFFKIPAQRDMVHMVHFGLTSTFDEAPRTTQGSIDEVAVAAINLAWANAAKYMSDLWKNEETRFNNLNSRAIALLGATSIITTLLGYVSKGVLDTNHETRLSAGQEGLAKVGTYFGLGLLALTAVILVLGVLSPRGRFISGNNLLVGFEDQRSDGKLAGAWYVGHALTGPQIDETMAGEYASIYVKLANRSIWKAYFLNVAYVVFTAAILAGLFTTVVVIWKVMPVVLP